MMRRTARRGKEVMMITYEETVTKDGNKMIGDFAFKGFSTDRVKTGRFMEGTVVS